MNGERTENDTENDTENMPSELLGGLRHSFIPLKSFVQGFDDILML